MSPGAHAGVSALIAVAAGQTWGPEAAVAAFAGGTAIDVDHFLDWRWNRQGRFTPRRFVERCVRFQLPRFYLVAHTLEWILPFLWWAACTPAPGWAKGCACGLLSHVVMDVMGNGMRLPAYLLVYRWAHGFDPRRFVYRLPPEAVAWWGSYGDWQAGRRRPRAPGHRG